MRRAFAILEERAPDRAGPGRLPAGGRPRAGRGQLKSPSSGCQLRHPAGGVRRTVARPAPAGAAGAAAWWGKAGASVDEVDTDGWGVSGVIPAHLERRSGGSASHARDDPPARGVPVRRPTLARRSRLSRLPGFSQAAPTARREGCAMTNDHFRQVRPNRRFRRLLPAAVAAVTIAASAPFAASAHAEAPVPAPHAARRVDPARQDRRAGRDAGRAEPAGAGQQHDLNELPSARVMPSVPIHSWRRAVAVLKRGLLSHRRESGARRAGCGRAE